MIKKCSTKNTFKWNLSYVSRHLKDAETRPSFTPLIYGLSSTQITNHEEKTGL